MLTLIFPNIWTFTNLLLFQYLCLLQVAHSLKKDDKTDVAAKLRKKESNDQPNEIVDTDTSTNPEKVVIIDGMVFVNVTDI